MRPAFNEVNQAIQEKERAINEAWADYNQAVPRAQGEAEQLVRAAEGYALERENYALGDAKRFEALYAEYRKAPDVTRKRMYLETMTELLPKLGQKVILDEKARGVLPLAPARRDGEGGDAVRSPLVAIIGVVLAIVVFSSVYTVSETEQVIITQFGKPVGGVVTDPGLHVKLPVIQNVYRFDKRWLEFDGDPNEIPTKGQEVHLGGHLRPLAYRRRPAFLPGGP